MPSIVSLLGIPILPIAGAAVEAYGLYVGIFLAGLVCVVGFFFIYFSLRIKSSDILGTTIADADISPALGK